MAGEFDFPECAVPGCYQPALSIVSRHGRRLVACGDHSDPPLGRGGAARLLDEDHRRAKADPHALVVATTLRSAVLSFTRTQRDRWANRAYLQSYGAPAAE